MKLDIDLRNNDVSFDDVSDVEWADPDWLETAWSALGAQWPHRAFANNEVPSMAVGLSA